MVMKFKSSIICKGKFYIKRRKVEKSLLERKKQKMEEIEKLVYEAKNGDEESFNKLYALTEKMVWFTCISLLKNEEDAKDAMQNTYITAFMKLKTLTDNKKFCGWIKRIAVNKCKDYFKSRAVYNSVEEEVENFTEAEEVILPEEYITRDENRSIILSLMENNLSFIQYQTAIMYYFDEMTIDEIAEIFECPKGTVMSRLNLARSKMKKVITEYEEKNSDRLYAFAPVPLFALLFKHQADSLIVPSINITIPGNVVMANTGILSQGAANIAKKGGIKMLETLKAKIIAAICALVVVGGGIAFAVILSESDSDNNISSEAGTSKTAEKDTTQAEKDTEDDDEDTIYVEYNMMDVRYTLPMMHTFTQVSTKVHDSSELYILMSCLFDRVDDLDKILEENKERLGLDVRIQFLNREYVIDYSEEYTTKTGIKGIKYEGHFVDDTSYYPSYYFYSFVFNSDEESYQYIGFSSDQIVGHDEDEFNLDEIMRKIKTTMDQSIDTIRIDD